MRNLFLFILISIWTPLAWGQEPQKITLMEGDSITLKANSEGAISYLWFKNGVYIPGETQQSLTITEAGIYSVIGVGKACDSDMSDEVQIIITDQPQPGPKLVDMQIKNHADKNAVLVGNSINYQIIVSNKGNELASEIKATIQLPDEVSYDEIFGNHVGNVVYDRNQHQVIWTLNQMAAGQSESLTIKVTSIEVGKAIQSALVTTLETESYPIDNEDHTQVEIFGIHIPNVFTPNNDGVNDVFEIKGLEFLSQNKITIFNVNGNEVYKANGYKNDWNGGGLNTGTYYYILEIQMPNGQWEIFKGYVMILR